MSKRSNHVLRQQRIANRRVDRALMHQIVAEHVYDEPAKIVFTHEALHREALAMDATQHLCFTRDCPLADWECNILAGDAMTASDIEAEAWAWLDEQPQDDDDEHWPTNEDVDHWITYAPDMDTVRDIFGGTDFIIIHNFRGAR